MRRYKKPKTTSELVGEALNELGRAVAQEFITVFMTHFTVPLYSAISLAVLHGAYNCKVKKLDLDSIASDLEIYNVLAEYSDGFDSVDYSYIFEHGLFPKKPSDDAIDLKDLMDELPISLFTAVASSPVVTQQHQQELFEIIKGLLTELLDLKLPDDATSNEAIYESLRIEKLAARMHSLLTNGFVRAPQLIDNTFARHNATLTIDLTTLHPTRLYKFDSFVFKQDDIESINVLHIQGIEFSDKHYALLCDLQSLILSLKIKARHFSYSLPAQALTTELDYKILALLHSIEQSLTGMKLANPEHGPLSPQADALNRQLWVQRAENVFTANNLTPAYSYKDIARALRQPYPLETNQPQLFAYLMDRIKRLHDSVLYKVYLHAIITNAKHLRRLCEARLPDENLKTELQCDADGCITLEPNDLQIVDGLVLKKAGATIRFSGNFNAQQLAASKLRPVQKLARAPLSTLIAYKQFLCTLDLHDKPEESLNLLDEMDANERLRYLFESKSHNLCCDVVTSKILHFRMEHSKTLRLEHTALREAYDQVNHGNSYNKPQGCVIS